MDILFGTVGEVENNSIMCLEMRGGEIHFVTTHHSYLIDNPKYILVDSDKYASGGYAITEKLYSIVITNVYVNYIMGVEVGLVLDVLYETELELAVYYGGFINSYFVFEKGYYGYEKVYMESNLEFIDGM